MKLTARTDLDVPVDVVYTSLADHASWEREAVRNGVEIERPAGTPDSGVGATWRVRGHFKGKSRKAVIRIDQMTADQLIALSIDSPTMDGVARIEIVALSMRRSRVRMDLEIKPKTLAARLFVNTMRLAKGRVQAKFERGLAHLGGRISSRYQRDTVRA